VPQPCNLGIVFSSGQMSFPLPTVFGFSLGGRVSIVNSTVRGRIGQLRCEISEPVPERQQGRGPGLPALKPWLSERRLSSVIQTRDLTNEIALVLELPRSGSFPRDPN
jgi:hypothetical protein